MKAFRLWCFVGMLVMASVVFAQEESPDDDTAAEQGGEGEAGGEAGGEADAEATPAPTAVTLATPEEFRSYMESERAAIAREREALLVLRAEVKKEVEKLAQLQAQIDKRMEELDEERESKVKKLVKIYSAMKPDEVKPLISKLDEDLMLRVLYMMKPKDQAAILALYSPDEAAKISEKIMKKTF